MQDFPLENIIKQPCTVITMMHWQTVSVFISAQYLAYLNVSLFVILKVVWDISGFVQYLKNMWPIEGGGEAEEEMCMNWLYS